MIFIYRTRKIMLEQICMFFKFFHIQKTRLMVLLRGLLLQSLTYQLIKMDQKLLLVQGLLIHYFSLTWIFYFIFFNFSDMTIKVKDISSSNKPKELVFTGHTAPILSVSLDPKSEFLVNFHLKIL